MKIVNIHEAKSQLSKLIELTLKGERIIIARNNHPVAELTKYQSPPKKRGLGMLKGKIWIADDCWDPDPETEKLFYTSELFPGEDIT